LIEYVLHFRPLSVGDSAFTSIERTGAFAAAVAEKPKPTNEPTWIRVARGVVPDIGIAVVRLRMERRLDIWIRADKPPQHWILHTTVHVHEPDRIEMLVPRVASLGFVAAGKPAA
jgi:hypothetical protein